MPTGLLFLVTLLVGVFFVIYKRQMLMKMFSINIASMADEFRIEMETTADQAVKRLEHQMAQLEYMLEEADVKIHALEDCLRKLEEKYSNQSAMSDQKIINQPPQTLDQKAFSPISQKSQPPTPTPEQAYSQRIQPQPLPQFIPRLQDVTHDKRQQVIDMHRQGYNVVQIAKATSMGKGEVMLLLELNKS